MTKKQWIRRITDDIVRNGNYTISFDPVIDCLAEILETKQKVFKEFTTSKEPYIVDGKKNLRLLLWDDLNKTALSYWRELGLTVASLKKIDEGAVKKKVQSPLEEVLSKLEA